MNINWKGVIILIIISILLIFGLVVVTANAISTDSDETVYYLVDPAHAQPGNTTNGTIEVYQRNTIYWGDVADLTLVSGWTGILIHAQTGKRVDISSFTHKILIDPTLFPVGEWDQWSDYDERHGNIVAFYVEEKRPPRNVTNVSPLLTPNITLIKPIVISPLPIRHVSDILVARGDPLNVAFKNAKIWIFGKTFAYYDYKTVNNSIVLNASDVELLEPGDYTLIAQEYTNASTNYNLRFNESRYRIEYFDPNDFQIKYIELFGLDGSVALEKFREIQKYTLDTFTEYKMTVATPYIEISSLDQQYVNETVFTQTVRGYTNLAIGTPITMTVDQDKVTDSNRKYSVFTTTVKGSDKPGDMRWFELTVPLIWDNFAPGHHTIIADSPLGASMSVDFNVYESPEHSFIPNNTIKYVGGNEFVPTPTPIIIEKVVTQEIIKTVIQTVTVPPPQESVNAATYDAAVKLIVQLFVLIVLTAGVIVTVVYFISVYRRKKEKEEEDQIL